MEQLLIKEKFAVVDGPFGTQLHADEYVDSGVPVIRIKNIGVNHFIADDLRYITEEKFQILKRSAVYPNDILLAKTGATIGKVCLVPKTIKKGLIASSCAKISIDDNKAVPSLVSHFLNTNFCYKQIIGTSVGSTRSTINLSNIRQIKVPDLKIASQKKIASILEACESAIQKRQEANRLTDEFLKSIFLEMFGDPVKNPKKWPVRRFGDIYSSIRYGTGSPPEYQEKGTPFIRATNVKNGTVKSSDMKFISPADSANIEKCKVSYGNLIIVRSGINAGDCALIPQQYDGAYAAYDLIVELPYHSAVFYNHLINSVYGKTMIAPMKRRAGQPHLNAEQIGSLKFSDPPPTEQKKFANIVQKVEKLKQKQRESEIELTNLFNSLMQRAFRGELCRMTIFYMRGK